MSELNLAKPAVEIELGGVTRHLLFDFWALSLVEEECGLAFLSNANGERLSSNKVIVLTWAGLLHEDPSLEGNSRAHRKEILRKQIAKWVFEAGLAEVTAKVVIALQNAFGKNEEAEQGEKNDQAGTGSPG